MVAARPMQIDYGVFAAGVSRLIKAHGHDRTDRDGCPLLTFIFGRKTVPDIVSPLSSPPREKVPGTCEKIDFNNFGTLYFQ